MGLHEAKKLLHDQRYHHLDKEAGYTIGTSLLIIYLIEDQYLDYIKNLNKQNVEQQENKNTKLKYEL